MNHWGKVSAIGAVTISRGRRHLGGPIVVVWDRWSAHRGRRVRLFLKGQSLIRVEWLPPYAPDLNPMDKGWAWMKSHRLANHGLSELDELTGAVADASEQARDRQELLRGFVRATGLPTRL